MAPDQCHQRAAQQHRHGEQRAAQAPPVSLVSASQRVSQAPGTVSQRAGHQRECALQHTH